MNCAAVSRRVASSENGGVKELKRDWPSRWVFEGLCVSNARKFDCTRSSPMALRTKSSCKLCYYCCFLSVWNSVISSTSSSSSSLSSSSALAAREQRTRLSPKFWYGPSGTSQCPRRNHDFRKQNQKKQKGTDPKIHQEFTLPRAVPD